MYTDGNNIVHNDRINELIINTVNSSPGIRQIDVAKACGMSVSGLRWRMLDLALKGHLRIEKRNSQVRLYPAEAAE